MPSTYTAVAGNVSLASGVTETLVTDGDALNAASVNTAQAKAADYLEALRQKINGTTPVAPTPAANWTAGNGLAYWKDASNIIHIKGSATWATGGAATAFTLPAGFRPSFSRLFPVVVGPTVFSVAQGFVDTSGNVTITPTPTVNGAVHYFDSFQFLAEA